MRNDLIQVTHEEGFCTLRMKKVPVKKVEIKRSQDHQEEANHEDDDQDIFLKHRVVTITDMQAIRSALVEQAKSKKEAVQVLNLSQCDFGEPRVLEELVDLIANDRHCPSHVNLSAAKFFAKSDFTQLLAAFHTNTTVVDLNVSNYLCSDYLEAHQTPLKQLLTANSTLQSLDLSGHCLDATIVQDLLQGLQHSVLKELKLHSCLLSQESASLLLEHATRLQTLDLSANAHFSMHFLNTSVAQVLQNPKSQLQSLTLDHSSTMFAAVAHASTTTETAQHLLRPFLSALAHNTQLQSLSLRYCRLSQAMGEALLRAVAANQTLTSLNLEFSGFGLRDEGNQILLRYIPQFQALQTLKILTQYPPALVPRLVQALQQNASLQHFTPRFTSRPFQYQERVQGLLKRNRRLAQAQTLLPPIAMDSNGHVRVTAAILPVALAQLSHTTPNHGAAATFQVLQHWIGECLGTPPTTSTP